MTHDEKKYSADYDAAGRELDKDRAAAQETLAEASVVYHDAICVATKKYEAALDIAFKAAETLKLKATIEYGLCGYVLEETTFSATSYDDLAQRINDHTWAWQLKLADADSEDGDLRRYHPELGNGYPSCDGEAPSFGSGEMFTGCLTSLIADGEKPDYNSDEHEQLRAICALD